MTSAVDDYHCPYFFQLKYLLAQFVALSLNKSVEYLDLQLPRVMLLSLGGQILLPYVHLPYLPIWKVSNRQVIRSLFHWAFCLPYLIGIVLSALPVKSLWFVWYKFGLPVFLRLSLLSCDYCFSCYGLRPLLSFGGYMLHFWPFLVSVVGHIFYFIVKSIAIQSWEFKW